MNCGFRQVFGTTTFGCLNEYRPDQARHLLEERRLNMSEIGQAIGFANRSYFAAAFRKKFGVTPREYLSDAEIPPSVQKIPHSSQLDF